MLRDVHRAHLLDIHLGQPLSLIIERIIDKIVNRRRGLVLESVTASEVHARTIGHIYDFRDVLRNQFDLAMGDDLDRLWPKVWASHQAWMQAGQP